MPVVQDFSGLQQAETPPADVCKFVYDRERSDRLHAQEKRQILVDLLKERFDQADPEAWHSFTDLSADSKLWSTVARRFPRTFEVRLIDYASKDRKMFYEVRLHRHLRRQLAGVI